MNNFIVHLSDCPESKDLDFLRRKLVPGIILTCGLELPTHGKIQMLIDGRPEHDDLDANPDIHWLVIPWTGLPPVTRQLLVEYPQIQVHNLHTHAAVVAEMAVALLLAATRFILPADKEFRQLNWEARDRDDLTHTLLEKNALLLGFGRIGKQIGKVCHALGMQIYVVHRNINDPKEIYFPMQSGGLADLDRLLGLCDALLISLPATEETKGLIDARRLGLMKSSAVIVNVGRGSVVEQGALYQALKYGRLRAAGLDVWYNYPKADDQAANTPPADYPFWELDNVVMSPHRAGTSAETEGLRMAGLAEMINAAAQGEVVPNRVDLHMGY